ncbi:MULTISPECIES: hypothetical protein [Thiorhodovibrio]|uniref:hypothetical protein n=1 Tax=Thiorhodovibrio TaxID=61593 RepID=UPI001911DB54|nr:MULTISPECIES: hypothetical protein [Thiorhodovibrio]
MKAPRLLPTGLLLLCLLGEPIAAADSVGLAPPDRRVALGDYRDGETPPRA